MEQFLMEALSIKAGAPIDLATAAASSPRIKVAEGTRVAIIVNMGDSTGGVASFDLQQHDAATAGTSKDLDVANPYYVKAAAATSFTKVEVSTAVSEYDLTSTFANEPGMVVFEVLAEDLDLVNGFAWVSVNTLISTAAAKLASTLLVLHDVRNKPAYSIVL